MGLLIDDLPQFFLGLGWMEVALFHRLVKLVGRAFASRKQNPKQHARHFNVTRNGRLAHRPVQVAHRQ
jgi:hypothetical protein